MPRPAGGLKNSNIAQAWLVLVLALIFGSTLAAVQVNLKDRITANKLNETLVRIPGLFWGADQARKMEGQNATVDIIPGTLEIQAKDKKTNHPLFRVDLKGQLAGWVIRAGGQGYADKIEILLGLDPHLETITGLFILEQKETPGLGNKITFTEWRNQFVHKQTSTPLEVQKGGSKTSHSIDAITGATISSRSVTSIVNQAISDFKGRLTPDSFQPLERK